ncbi:hypothetical protein C8Q73DRAFT_67873 [Cubamyces lactineus]|nr:hypothetical protein C8Q73DRAFT_67873 [Cubamyces lactineus]
MSSLKQQQQQQQQPPSSSLCQSINPCSSSSSARGLSSRIDPFPLDDRPSRDSQSHHADADSRSPADGPSPSARSEPPERASQTVTQDPHPTNSPSPSSPDLSRSSSQRGARLSSSFFPALAKARLALSSASAAASSSPSPREMRSSRPREPPPKPKPLLVLKLSGSSFLDTIIRDDKTKDPLYILETARELTSIYRLDHPRDEPVKAATVQWPLHPVRIKGKTGRSIQFGNGSWREAEDLLKTGPLGSTAIRKFSIPHYPNSLKWKLIPGNCFCCVTSAVKGPVAVLDAATLSAPPRLKVYHPLIERDVARSQDNYKGVPTVFLDYLVVTSLLLVTDVQEWLDRPREARIPGSSSYTVQRWLALIHHRPPPQEPDHPTVDLSLTVPSTPPHSATFPSPGAFWETQSGVTSFSGTGSNGSGSGASYSGEPFTPTTPATPATSAASANSSTFFSRPLEDVPPVPPVPGSGSGPSAAAGSSGGSSLGRHGESGRVRERPKSNPQTISHSPNTSTSTTHAPASSHPYSQGTDGVGDEDGSKQSRSRPGHTISVSGGGLAALSTSAPTSPLPTSATSVSSSSSRQPRRQLPVPPGPAPPNSYAQPWLYSAPSPASSSTPVASPPASATSTNASPSPNPGPSPAARAARASMRGSLRTIPIPPPPPPPQHSIPLPPKLAQEQQRSYAGRPRTAPELDDVGNRRRHSEGFSPLGGEGSAASPTDDGSAASSHPYAYAPSSVATSSSYSLRGRDGASDRDVQELAAQMQGLSTSPAGPGHLAHHVRAPSMPAPDYDTHSFVNVPPPLPIPPSSSSGTGSRPPARRQLTVVNADQSDVEPSQPTLHRAPSHPTLNLSSPSSSLSLSSSMSNATSRSMSAMSMSTMATSMSSMSLSCPPPPPSPGDPLRLNLNPRLSYAESVYEVPPPAYDAIDFSVQYVPPVPPIPAHLAVVNVPLPVPPSGGEGQRPS